MWTQTLSEKADTSIPLHAMLTHLVALGPVPWCSTPVTSALGNGRGGLLCLSGERERKGRLYRSQGADNSSGSDQIHGTEAVATLVSISPQNIESSKFTCFPFSNVSQQVVRVRRRPASAGPQASVLDTDGCRVVFRVAVAGC